MPLQHRRQIAFALLFGLIVPAVACGGSMGEITNEIRDDLSFVVDDQNIFVHPEVNKSGAERISVNGENRLDYFPGDYRLRDVLPDASLWVLGNPNNNIYILHQPGQMPHQVDFFNGRARRARISPDGQTIAIILHADYSVPQSRQHETVDDTIYLVHAHSYEIRTLPNETDRAILSLDWTDDGQSLYIGLFDWESQYLVDVETGARTPVDQRPENLHYNRTRGASTCALNDTEISHDDQGIYITHTDGQQEHLVVIEGRERGFHDYQSTIKDAFYTETCNTVVFVYHRIIWVADVETGTVGQLMEGRSASVLDEV